METRANRTHNSWLHQSALELRKVYDRGFVCLEPLHNSSGIICKTSLSPRTSRGQRCQSSFTGPMRGRVICKTSPSPRTSRGQPCQSSFIGSKLHSTKVSSAVLARPFVMQSQHNTFQFFRTIYGNFRCFPQWLQNQLRIQRLSLASLPSLLRCARYVS